MSFAVIEKLTLLILVLSRRLPDPLLVHAFPATCKFASLLPTLHQLMGHRNGIQATKNTSLKHFASGNYPMAFIELKDTACRNLTRNEIAHVRLQLIQLTGYFMETDRSFIFPDHLLFAYIAAGVMDQNRDAWCLLQERSD
jgi:hypothetical protein